MLPCIIFSFSRKECEAYALSLKDMDFNEEEEKKLVREIYNSAIDLLSDEDKKLPQIGQVQLAVVILPLLLRGIGVHHSGLLPILKETVEILFGEGLLKTLFATETFSMGLNMPARTVLFTSARKFDGADNRWASLITIALFVFSAKLSFLLRWITSGEYIQMSGRAGRRGKDDRGLVILMVDHKMSSEDAKQIIKGATDPLNSQFRLTYNMVLNLLRVEGVNPEFMLERSFYQFQNYDAIPGLKKKTQEKAIEIENMHLEHERDITAFFDMEKQGATDPLNSQFRLTYNMVLNLLRVEGVNPEFMLERSFYQFQNYDAIPGLKKKTQEKAIEIENMHLEHERDITAFFDMEKQIANLQTTIKKTICMPKYLVPFLHAGRMIHVVAGTRDFGWTVLVNFHRKTNVDDSSQMATWDVVSIALDCVDEISAVRLKLPRKLDSNSKGVIEQMIKVSITEIQSVKQRFAKIPLLHPVNDMRITEPAFVHAVEKATELEQRSQEHPLRKNRDFEMIKKQYLVKVRSSFKIFGESSKIFIFPFKEEKRRELKSLEEELRKAQSVLQLDELSHRKRLLRRLEYADKSDIITEKVCLHMYPYMNYRSLRFFILIALALFQGR
ncbi:unnamed protein product, partial [Cylicostephanus goldi]